MNISVMFLGAQRDLANTGRIHIQLDQATRVADVLVHLRKLYPEMPFPEHALLVSVNDRASTMDRMLEEHDVVTFLPLMGGG